MSDYQISKVYPSDKRTNRLVSELLIKEGIRKDGNLDYTCAMFDDDMNVIAGGGLVGIVTKTGPDWAQVRSIIDDMSNVSAMILKNSDLCYVRGDLEMMSEGTLQLNQLRDQNDEVESGDKVVTSYASAKYHKGILIGYVNELAVDSNNLTKSGSITPAVDFEHLSTVLVITDLKQQVDESQADATEEDMLLDETTETE